ncbi:unnamed protein product [Vitrella brassicaformis CCMP3155]|uniref:J domain-containing protein n=1 Tax=Vitrella brassicaformis (strain CCMP3155) TaxID=1169540 RepID=A0A0G4EXV2_VITBC|nr:unnamed protein product [Vitrella brassicaformis CCMP3155]|eukprot:CEM04139.1 unnamed protein product [Vitrella brassicaformis CCMP3155]
MRPRKPLLRQRRARPSRPQPPNYHWRAPPPPPHPYIWMARCSPRAPAARVVEDDEEEEDRDDPRPVVRRVKRRSKGRTSHASQAEFAAVTTTIRQHNGTQKHFANHPDKGGDKAAFQAISEAHEALTGLSGGGAASDGRQRDGPCPYGYRTFREWQESPEAAATARETREWREAEIRKAQALLAERERKRKEEAKKAAAAAAPSPAKPPPTAQGTKRKGASAEDKAEPSRSPTNGVERGAADRSRVTRPEGFKAPPVGPATKRPWAAAAAPPPNYQWRSPPPPPHPYIRMARCSPKAPAARVVEEDEEEEEDKDDGRRVVRRWPFRCCR